MEGFQRFLDTILSLNDVWFVTSWQAIQWMRNLANPVDPLNFEPFQCKETQKQVCLFSLRDNFEVILSSLRVHLYVIIGQF